MTTLFLDMDGVVADFEQAFTDLSKKDITKISNMEKYYWFVIINKLGPDFWSELKPMPYAHLLWNAFKQYKPTFLTAALRNGYDSSVEGKTKWIQQHFGYDKIIVVRGAKEKWKYCRPGDILVDDMPKNIQEWNEAGGIGFLYHPKDTKKIITEVQKVLD